MRLRIELYIILSFVFIFFGVLGEVVKVEREAAY